VSDLDHSELLATPERALLRRRRRDGVVVLVGADGSDASAAFPPWRTFTAASLLIPDVASVAKTEDGVILVELGNARASYRIVGHSDNGDVVAVLEGDERFDPPVLDEHRAFELQLGRRDREVNEIAAAYGVDEVMAERIAVDFGRIPPKPSEWEG
jgi:radical SAM superfamily enzyme YgiQ (UPF0313 family)